MPHKTVAISAALLLAAMLSGASVRAASSDKPVKPIPVAKELLEGTRLVLKSANCSLDLPAAGWAWMTYDKSGTNYLCVNPKSMDTYLISIGELKGEMTDHHPQSLLASAKKTMAARGGSVEHDKFEFIELGDAKKTARVSFTQIENGTKTSICIYLINTVDRTLLKISCNSPTAAEPTPFGNMVKTLKIRN